MIKSNTMFLRPLMILLIGVSCALGADTSLDVEASASGLEPSPAYLGEKVRVLLDATASEPDLEHEEDYVVSKRWYWSAVDVSLKDGDDWIDPPEGSVTHDSIEQDEEDEAPATLWAVFHVPGTWQIQLTATIVYTDNNNVQHTDSDEVTVLVEVKGYEVDVVAVPQYLFFSAQYATPIKFKIIGREGRKYEMSSISGKLMDADEEVASFSTSSRFAADDGKERRNGESDTYTCFVSSGSYTKDLKIVSSTKGKFVVEATVKPVNGPNLPDVRQAKSYLAKMDPDDAEAKVKRMADNRLYALDMPSDWEEIQLEMSPAVNLPGSYADDGSQSDMYQWWHSTLGQVNKPEQTGQWALSPSGGTFDDAGHVYKEFDQVGELWAQAWLKDDFDYDATARFGDGLKARAYAFRRGGMFYISYGGRDLDQGILEAGERAMDLAKDDGTFDLQMFKSGHANYTVTAGTSSSINVWNAVEQSFAVTAFLLNPPAGAALFYVSTAHNAMRIINTVDSETNINDQAEAAIYRNLGVTRSNGVYTPEGGSALAVSYYSDVGEKDEPSLALCAAGKPCAVGDQWVAWVELEAAAAGISTDALLGSVDSSATVIYHVGTEPAKQELKYYIVNIKSD